MRIASRATCRMLVVRDHNQGAGERRRAPSWLVVESDGAVPDVQARPVRRS